MANNAIDIWPAAFYAKHVATWHPDGYSYLRCPKCGSQPPGYFTDMDTLVMAALDFDARHTDNCKNGLYDAREILHAQ
jgi:hypothetical protein